MPTNTSTMHSYSHCHKQKVNHACLEGLFLEKGKSTIVLSCIHKDLLIFCSGSPIRQWPKGPMKVNVNRQIFGQSYLPSSKGQKRKHRCLHWASVETEKKKKVPLNRQVFLRWNVRCNISETCLDFPTSYLWVQ